MNYIDENIWSYFNPLYDDYTYENDDMSITNNQETRYLIDRILVSGYNIIDSSLFIGIDTPTGTIVYTYNNPTKNDMYKIIADFTSGYLLIESGNVTIIIDSTNKDTACCIFKLNGSVVNVYETTDFNRALQTTFVGSSYLSIKLLAGNGNASSVVNKIKSHGFSPSGNMYIITDYDTDLIESTFLDILSDIES